MKTKEKQKKITFSTPKDVYGQPLSKNQLAIARAVAQGLTHVEIAKRFVISDQTVKNQLHISYRKLGIKNKQSLAVWFVMKYGNPFKRENVS